MWYNDLRSYCNKSGHDTKFPEDYSIIYISFTNIMVH